jgi:hypothetical protein
MIRLVIKNVILWVVLFISANLWSDKVISREVPLIWQNISTVMIVSFLMFCFFYSIKSLLKIFKLND